MSTFVLMLIAAGGSILLGLPYLVHAFGPTEAEVVSWGQVAIATGAVLAGLVLLLWRQRHRWAQIVLSVGYGWLALLQVLPIVLWLLFHGTGISDGSPPSPFTAHWAFALPHLALFVLSAFILRQLPRN
ncbi:MAG: hypothetical protein RBT75_05245 [Anaerolineae bacterium]|jgi:predicted membrane channel-forming protein YqfA (hemolysin III family)|nr:hypothetical protein [Anaerolineae bacterium]